MTAANQSGRRELPVIALAAINPSTGRPSAAAGATQVSYLGNCAPFSMLTGVTRRTWRRPYSSLTAECGPKPEPVRLLKKCWGHWRDSDLLGEEPEGVHVPRAQQAEVAPVQGGLPGLVESLDNCQDGDDDESVVRMGIPVADIPGPAVTLERVS